MSFGFGACSLALCLSVSSLAAAPGEGPSAQVRELKEILQPSYEDPLGHDLLSEGTAVCLDCTGQSHKTVPSGCDVKSPRDDLKLIPQNWGLISTGVDLLQEEAAFQKLEYKNSLAIVDSGLRLKGNPEAGEGLSRYSPEAEGGRSFHGSHVSGVAASKSFGVNPELPTKVFPVEMEIGGLAQSENFLNSLDRAVNDRTVKVINLSWSFVDRPRIVDLVRKAMESNKWIVFAAGNSDRVSDLGSAGHDQVMSDPAFFNVGSFSYFGAPSSFSNFGPDVTVYAPGSHIRSLDGAYNPNYSSSSRSVVMEGTSMAAPHFAALLTTLSNLAPDISAESLQFLIRSTALNQGTEKKPVPFLNAYLAFKTLENARSCLKSSVSPRDCLEKSRQDLRSRIRMPPRPTSSSCTDWKAYYKALRRLYFLSQGHPAIAKEIQALFHDEKKPLVEKFLFLPPGNQAARKKLLADQTIPGVYGIEKTRAIDFVSGKLDFEVVQKDFESTGNSNAGPSKQKHPLDLMLPSQESFPDFLRFCEDALSSRPSGAPCGEFLENAPRKFKVEFFNYVNRREPPSSNIRLLKSAGQGLGPEYFVSVKAAMQRAFNRCSQTRSFGKNDLEELYSDSFLEREQKRTVAQMMLDLSRREEVSFYFTSTEKDQQVGYWKIMTELGDSSKPELEKAKILYDQLLSRDQFGGSLIRRKLQFWAFLDEPEALTQLRYSSLLAKEGYPTPDLSKKLGQTMDALKDLSSNIGGNFTLSLNLLISSRSANELAAFLTEPRRLEDLQRITRESGNFSNLLSRLLKSKEVDPRNKELLIGALQKSLQSRSIQVDDIYQRVLKENEDEPLVQQWIAALKTPEGQKDYPELAKKSLWQSLSQDRSTPELEKLIEINQSSSPDWILAGLPVLGTQNQKVDHLLRKVFNRIESNPRDVENLRTRMWWWISQMDNTTIHKYGSDVLQILPTLLGGDSLPDERTFDFLQKLVASQGDNSEVMKKAIETLRPFVRDEKFAWRTKEESIQSKEAVRKLEKSGELMERGASLLLKSYILLNESSAGQKILKNDPVWKDLASRIKEELPMDVPSLPPEEGGKAMNIPEPLQAIYRQRALGQIKKLKSDSRISSRESDLEEVISRDSTMIPIVLDRLDQVKKGSESYRYLVKLVVSFARRSPENADFVFKRLGNSNHVVYESSLFRPSSTTPLRKTLQELMDYE